MAQKKKIEPIVRATHRIDATDQAVGRLATRVALLLRGKNKATFRPHIDGGDIVLITNAASMKLTGQKKEQKVYHRYSGYPGGLKTEKLSQMWEKNPEEILRRAVLQMLPPIRLRPAMMKRLTILK